MALATALGLVLAAASGWPGAAAAKPMRGCATTSIMSIGPRLEGVADSGVFVRYRNGLHQVSYDPIPGLANAREGDAVRLCLLSRPRNCPAGDIRGGRYAAVNQRTGARWTAYDSSHRCGGA